MRVGDFEFQVLVEGRPVKEYEHNGHTFIEAKKGTEYSLKVRNHSSDRVEAVISVDGLSIMDGKPASMSGAGYVYGAHTNPSAIPGWRVNDDTTARFKFGSKATGYAKQTQGDDGNRGMIGFAIFREQYVAPVVEVKEIHHHHDHYIDRDPWHWPYYPRPYPYPRPYWGVTLGSTSGGGGGTSSSTALGNAQISNTGGGEKVSLSNLTMDSAPVVRSARLGVKEGKRGLSVGVAAVEDERSLATAFGDAVNFNVGHTSFIRANADKPDVSFQFLYRTRAELEKLGVDLKGKPQVASPSAFPADGDGCPLPPGWAVENMS